MELFRDKSTLPKRYMKPNDYTGIPKSYGIITKQNPKEYLVMLTAYIECLNISEMTKLDIVNTATCDSAKGWFLFKRKVIENSYHFCEEFLNYYCSFENVEKKKE